MVETQRAPKLKTRHRLMITPRVQEIENQSVEEVAEATTIDFCERLAVLKDKEEE